MASVLRGCGAVNKTRTLAGLSLPIGTVRGCALPLLKTYRDTMAALAPKPR